MAATGMIVLIFAYAMRPLGIAASQVLLSGGLTSPPQPIFSVGIGHLQMLHERLPGLYVATSNVVLSLESYKVWS